MEKRPKNKSLFNLLETTSVNPILKGKNTSKLKNRLKNVKPISRAEYLRAKEIYSSLKNKTLGL